ncbi:hypothetical protein [Suttonella ornithocola]|uniref:hypothetical protein n=1 Tax=Suttonella ornithocola TaxID=279832 RepID=UPI0009FE0427
MTGNNVLIGGEGNDKLWGGTGNDTFIFHAEHGQDWIDAGGMLFSGYNDTIVLHDAAL